MHEIKQSKTSTHLSNGQVTYNFAPVAFRNEYGSEIGMPKGPASKQEGFLKGF